MLHTLALGVVPGYDGLHIRSFVVFVAEELTMLFQD